jgi:xanthine dehydrogenase accessory factor
LWPSLWHSRFLRYTRRRVLYIRPKNSRGRLSGAERVVRGGGGRGPSPAAGGCMIADVLRVALEALAAGEPFAVATVIAAEGSSPGKPGHKMLLRTDGRQVGTIGGGQLELHVQREVQAMLARGRGGVLTYSFEPGAPNNPGMTCGGGVTIAVEVVPAAARVLLCGGGHVAQALARQLRELGYAHVIVDERPAIASREQFPDAAAIRHDAPPAFIQANGLSGFSHVIIFTHDHTLDRETLLAVARSGFAGYVGLIGSARKWVATRQALLADGVAEDWIGRVHCPIGLSIGACTPAEIAVSIAAELIKEKGVHA